MSKSKVSFPVFKVIQTQIVELRGALALLKRMSSVSEFFADTKRINVYTTSLLGNNVWIKVYSIEALEEARKLIRSLFPGQAYSDVCRSVYAVGNEANAWYTVKIDNKDIPLDIELIMPVENFPTLKEGCGFKKKTIKEPATEHETWVYACEANA